MREVFEDMQNYIDNHD